VDVLPNGWNAGLFSSNLCNPLYDIWLMCDNGNDMGVYSGWSNAEIYFFTMMFIFFAVTVASFFFDMANGYWIKFGLMASRFTVIFILFGKNQILP